MTLRKGKTKSERFQQTEKGVEQLQMAIRMNQMLIQQLGTGMTTVSKDLGEQIGRQREVQYKILAIQELLKLNADEVTAKAEELQIRDFSEASAKEDAAQGYTDTDLVTENSVVILTSKVGATGGILRTRLKVSEIGFPQFKQDLIGKRVNDTLDADIGGAKHSITLLGIKQTTEEIHNVGQPEHTEAATASN